MRSKRLLHRLRSTFRTGTVPARRQFLKGAAAAWLAAVFGIGCGDSPAARESTAVAAPAAEPLPEFAEERYQRLLALIAGAVLPSKIDASGQRRIAAEFSAWLASYDPATEPVQYSTYEFDPSAGLTPYPRSRIEDDLREIESSSLEEFSRPFEELDLSERQALLRELVARYPVGTVRGWIFRQDGHVALSLLDFYYHFRMVHGARRRG